MCACVCVYVDADMDSDVVGRRGMRELKHPEIKDVYLNPGGPCEPWSEERCGSAGIVNAAQK